MISLAVRKALITRNLSATAKAVIVVIAFYYQYSLPEYWMIIFQGQY
jgi:hypothetical protein